MTADQVLEFLKFVAPAFAAAAASYFAGRERIRVLEVKLEGLRKDFDDLRDELNRVFPRAVPAFERRR